MRGRRYWSLAGLPREALEQTARGSPAALYRSILVCAREQASALAREDLEGFERLAAQRSELTSEAQRSMDERPPSPTERRDLVDLLRSVMAIDVQNKEALEAIQSRLLEQAAELRRERALATRYRPLAVAGPGGGLVDAHR